MNILKKYKSSLTMMIISIILVSYFVTVSVANENVAEVSCLKSTGYIGSVRGGIGVTAVIDNEDLSNPFSNSSASWQILIEGDFVLFGSSQGIASPKSIVRARSSKFPPTFGFGEVSIKIKVMKGGSVVALEQKNAFMVGPFVFGIR